MKISFHHRRRWPYSNFSIESIFENLRCDLQDSIEAQTIVCPHHSKGIVRRICNIWHAARNQADVNHVTGDVNYLAMGLVRRNTILTHHDSSFMVRTRGLRRFALGLFWLRLPVWRSRFVTTVSDATRQDLLSYTKCSPDKVIVIHNAISRDFKSIPKPNLGSPPRILQIGTAVNKNLPRLAKALRGLHCHLTIIGRLSGVQRDSLESEGIQFENLLDLTNAEVRQQYALADIVSFASTIEGFGMPILEAQATGRPVVTSNCSSMPEVAGDAACLVNPFDPQSIRTGISRIIADQGYRQSLVEKGYNNVLRFDRDKIAEQYLQLYKQVASEDS